MSDEETKQRFSARVTTDTLDELEQYQHDNGLGNRSAAIEHLVAHRNEVERAADRWETIAQQALYAVTFSLMVAVISTASFVVAVVLAGYPSPWAVVSASVLFGALLASTGGGIGYRYSRSKARVETNEVKT